MRHPLLLLLALTASTALAEGSLNFAPTGTTNNRAFLEVGPASYNTSGIQRKTTLYAYANSGETLLLGSSAMGVGNADIKITAPDNTTQTCVLNTLGSGLISKRANEVAGPVLAGRTVTNGYSPCSYAVATTGIYQIEMLAPTLAGGNPAVTKADGEWAAPKTSDTWIAAWDVTVVSGSATQTRQPGRVFARYFAMNVGGNDSANTMLTVYPLTRDGYMYKLTLDFDPYGYIFYANTVGTLTAGAPTGVSAYKSVPVNSPQYNPAQADSGNYVTHKLFLSQPDAALPSSASAPTGVDGWLLRPSPTLPPQPTNLTFTGTEGTPGQAGGGIGGTFSFTNPSSAPAPYRIVLGFKAATNGVNSDRILVGTASSGNNSVAWDGKDGDGKPVIASQTAYTVKAYLAAGEIHFPLIDAENLSDLTVQRLNSPGSDAATVYWDDRSVTAGGTPPTPLNALGGVDSTGAATHAYSGNWGNDLTVDTWAYYPGTAADFPSGVKVSEADVQVSKTYVSGGSTTAPALFDVVVKNASTTTSARNVRIQDALPTGVASMTWSCPGCATTSGTGAVDTLATLTPGASVTVRVTATLSATSGKGTGITNTATASRGLDAPDPNMGNNSATASFTAMGTPSITLTKRVKNITTGGNETDTNSARPGDVLEYVIYFRNTGDGVAKNLVINDLLVGNLTPAATGTVTCPAASTSSSFTLGSNTLAVNLGTICGDLAGTGSAGAAGEVRFRATMK